MFTADDFDQARRDLAAMRVKYRGRKEVTTRIGNLIGQLATLRHKAPEHRTDLDRMIARGLRELAELTSQ
jgi:hypothetical protein